MEAEESDGAGDKFAVERWRDEDGDLFVAEAMRAHEERAMPEGKDDWARDFNADGHALARGVERVDVAVAQCRAECADEQCGERRNDGEQKSLLAREDRHEDECSCCASAAGGGVARVGG